MQLKCILRAIEESADHGGTHAATVLDIHEMQPHDTRKSKSGNLKRKYDTPEDTTL